MVLVWMVKHQGGFLDRLIDFKVKPLAYEVIIKKDAIRKQENYRENSGLPL